MNVKEIRDLSNEELEKEVVSLKEELYGLRFAQATGNLENPSRVKDIKKTIARIYTVLTERENAEAAK
jgi:large subunit ribosomal protein L29